MHTPISRAAWVCASSLTAALVLLAPAQTLSAQSSSTATRNGWGYGFQVQLWHYDKVARSNVIGDVTQAGFNWMTQQVEWMSVETDVGSYDMACARLVLMERLWGRDNDFLAKHRDAFERKRTEQFLKRAKWLIARGRTREARADLRQAGSSPLSYRILAWLPGPMVRGLLGMKRLFGEQA